MAFSQTENARISKRWNGTGFVEEDLIISGVDGVTVTVGEEGFEISGAGVAVSAKDNGTLVSDGVKIFDFDHALDVSDEGSGEIKISVDENEFTSVVFLTGNQTVAGEKTFSGNAVFSSNLGVAGDVSIDGNLTVNGTTTAINTEEVLIEDSAITLNSTVIGSPSTDAYLAVNRGEEDNAHVYWNETLDQWEAGLAGNTEKVILQSDLDSTVVYLTGDQSITGAKTFANIVVTSLDVTNGSISSAPSDPEDIANKSYVDSVVSSAQISIEDGGVEVISALSTMNFGHALEVTDQSNGEVLVDVDESEFTTVAFLAGDQTFSGKKTFSGGIVVASGTEPEDSADAAGGVAGEIRYSDDYLYVNVDGTNWKRTALALF